MGTSVNIAIQQLNATAYSLHKLFLTIDPAFNIAGVSPFILEAKIRKVSFGINEHIGICDLEFPQRVFGNHVGTFVLPVAVYVDNTDNFVFRGFFTDEVGVISPQDDQLTASCHDYKWLIGKFSKIRGKIFTIDNNVFPQFTPGNTNVFGDESLYERFRMVIPGLNVNGQDVSQSFGPNGTGFLGTEHTIFNEHGDPDCSQDSPFSGGVAFMYDSDLQYLRGIGKNRRSSVRYKWNYATMIRYVCTNYITNIFNGVFRTTQVLISETALSNIYRYGQTYGMELIQPTSFDITNKSPMEAIDHIVKHIPGSWYWRLLYYPNSVVIDIQNHSDVSFVQAPKYFFLGTGAKLNNKTNNQVNIASCKVHMSAKNAISHAVAVGGGIDIETSIQYIPGWEQYVRPQTDFSKTKASAFDADVQTAWDGVTTIPSDSYLCDFKGFADYNIWKQWLNKDTRTSGANSGKVRELVSADDQHRYAKIYRTYVFPENQFQITQFSHEYINQLIPGYENLATYIDQLFYKYILRKRKIKAPLTQYREIFNYAPFTDDYSYKNLKQQIKDKHHADPPFVFLYDSLIGTPLKGEGSNASTLLPSKKWIIPQEEKKNSYQFEQENRALVFSQPQFERNTFSANKLEDEVIANFTNIASRSIFVTCRVECDVPLIKDQIYNRNLYSNARLVSQELHKEVEAVIRINAFFPNPKFFASSILGFDKGSDSDMVGSIVDGGSDETTVIGSKLVNWNNVVLGSNAPNAMLIHDDSAYLNQVLQFLLFDKPSYEIDADFDLGRIDTSYIIGDRIDGIKGSQLIDGSGGYFGMNCVIDKFEYIATGEKTDTFTTKGTMRNTLPVVDFIRQRVAVKPQFSHGQWV